MDSCRVVLIWLFHFVKPRLPPRERCHLWWLGLSTSINALLPDDSRLCQAGKTNHHRNYFMFFQSIFVSSFTLYSYIDLWLEILTQFYFNLRIASLLTECFIFLHYMKQFIFTLNFLCIFIYCLQFSFFSRDLLTFLHTYNSQGITLIDIFIWCFIFFIIFTYKFYVWAHIV